MQRPVMDPMFVKDLGAPKKYRLPYLRWMIAALKWFGRSLMSNPLTVQRPEETISRPRVTRVLVRTAISWTLLLPVLSAATTFGLVLLATHPTPPPVLTDPNSQGCFFDPVTFTSDDGTQLAGWLVPAVDARRVIDEKDRVLHARRPAIVLVHDFGQSPQQWLPLVRPLHEQGVVVLFLGLRGTGTDKRVGQTFGLKEAKDVAAAVQLLRGQPFVDASRIAVAGIGSGANAALIDASRDRRIRAVIMVNPLRSCDQAIARIAPHRHGLEWMKPVYRRVFEWVYSVDGKDLDWGRYAGMFASRSQPIMLIENDDSMLLQEADKIKQMNEFCRRQLHTDEKPTVIFGSAK